MILTHREVHDLLRNAEGNTGDYVPPLIFWGARVYKKGSDLERGEYRHSLSKMGGGWGGGVLKGTRQVLGRPLIEGATGNYDRWKKKVAAGTLGGDRNLP